MATHSKISTALSSDDAPSGHDEWFRAEVEKTIARLKDGSAVLISEEEHDARWREKRAALLAAARKPE